MQCFIVARNLVQKVPISLSLTCRDFNLRQSCIYCFLDANSFVSKSYKYIQVQIGTCFEGLTPPVISCLDDMSSYWLFSYIKYYDWPTDDILNRFICKLLRNSTSYLLVDISGL